GVTAAAALAALANSSRFVHPWLREVRRVPPGKLWMLSTLHLESYAEIPYRRPGDVPLVAPFISQPLIELCLRIPTYLNVDAGRSRAVARRAFSDVLAPEILSRTTKGTCGLWLKGAIDRNQRFIRDYLMDGLLVKKCVLDRRKLEAVLPGS